MSGGVVGLQLRYSTYGHDNIVLIRLAEPIDGVDVRDLLKQLGFGIRRIGRCSTCRGDLQVEMAHAVRQDGSCDILRRAQKSQDPGRKSLAVPRVAIER